MILTTSYRQPKVTPKCRFSRKITNISKTENLGENHERLPAFKKKKKVTKCVYTYYFCGDSYFPGTSRQKIQNIYLNVHKIWIFNGKRKPTKNPQEDQTQNQTQTLKKVAAKTVSHEYNLSSRRNLC